MSEKPILILSNIIIDDITLADGTTYPATLGGAATYAATAARQWWPKVGIIAGVGADLDTVTGGRLGAFGLRPEGHVVRDAPSIHNRLVYFTDGERSETPLRGEDHFALLQTGPADIPAGLLPAEGAYVFRGTDRDFWAQLEALRFRLGAVLWELQDDAALADHLDRIESLLPLVDIFSLNRSEAARLYGGLSDDEVLDRLLATGLPAIALRRGGEGALVATPTERFAVTPPPSEVVDVTGGGNAFCGGFLAGWCQSPGDARHAARCAAASAARALMQYGPADPTETQNAQALHGATTLTDIQ